MCSRVRVDLTAGALPYSGGVAASPFIDLGRELHPLDLWPREWAERIAHRAPLGNAVRPPANWMDQGRWLGISVTDTSVG